MARGKLQTSIEESNRQSGEEYALLMGESVKFDNETIVIDSGKKIGDFSDDVELK